MIYYRIYLSFCIAKYIKIDSSIIKTQLHTRAVHSGFVRALLGSPCESQLSLRITALLANRESLQKVQKGTERYRKVQKGRKDTN